MISEVFDSITGFIYVFFAIINLLYLLIVVFSPLYYFGEKLARKLKETNIERYNSLLWPRPIRMMNFTRLETGNINPLKLLWFLFIKGADKNQPYFNFYLQTKYSYLLSILVISIGFSLYVLEDILEFNIQRISYLETSILLLIYTASIISYLMYSKKKKKTLN